MLPPEYLEHAADDIVDLYSQLDQLIIRDIVRRIMKAGRITDTAAWQINRVQESGLLYNEVITEVSKFSGASESQVRALFEDFGVEAINYDRTIYTAAGLSPPPLAMSPAAQQVLNAGLRKTSGYLQNLTQTTASGAQQAYIHATTIAEMQVDSGAFDYTTAIRNAVRSAIEGGNWITYPTGHHDRLDVATRRAVMTGVNQTSAQVSLAYADDMGCDLVETTAHIGARPEHAVWQGKVFSRSGNNRKYPDFVENTRYGYGDGLCGWNCRHNFYPFFEGISESAYPKQKLDEYKNKTVEYQGVKMSYYDATQRQRAMERAVRDSKRQAAGYDEAVKSAKDEATAKAMKQEFNSAAVKLKQQESILKDFTQKTGLERQRNLEQVFGFSHSQSSKAIWVNKKVDIQRQRDIIKEEIRSAGKLPKAAKIHLTPTPINTDSLSFDDKHINAERGHNVTQEQTTKWIRDAKISVTVWNGQYERYYGVEGAVYVDKIKSLVRTAYPSGQYEDNVKAMLEVILKNGL
jgi:hypothetical protein